MAYTIEQIATALGAKAFGAVGLEIDGLAEPADASARDLALAMKPEYAESLPKGAAKAAMVWDGADWQALGLEAAIISPRPRYAMSGLTTMMDPGQGWGDGIHPSAVVDDTAELAPGVTGGPAGGDLRGRENRCGYGYRPAMFRGHQCADRHDGLPA